MAWGLTGFYPSMVFITLVYNSGDKNVCYIINDWYTCLHVVSKQLTVWDASFRTIKTLFGHFNINSK